MEGCLSDQDLGWPHCRLPLCSATCGMYTYIYTYLPTYMTFIGTSLKCPTPIALSVIRQLLLLFVPTTLSCPMFPSGDKWVLDLTRNYLSQALQCHLYRFIFLNNSMYSFLNLYWGCVLVVQNGILIGTWKNCFIFYIASRSHDLWRDWSFRLCT